MDINNLLRPTFDGYIDTLADANLLVESCVRGLIKPFPRRIAKSERNELIQSGNVFIYQEHQGLVRWTDGKSWTRGRKDGDFIVYEEEEEDEIHTSPKSRKTEQSVQGISKPKPHHRVPTGQLIGNGSHPRLRKKSASLGRQLGPTTYARFHVISYYTLEDVPNLPRPSKSHQYMHLHSNIDGEAYTQSMNRVFNPAAGSNYLPPHEHDARLPMGLPSFGPLSLNRNYDFSDFQRQHLGRGYQIEPYRSREWY